MVFAHFYRYVKGAFCTKSVILMGSNGRLKLGKLLNLIRQIGDKSRQFSVSLLLFFQTPGIFY